MITGRGMPYEVKIDPLCLYDVWVGYDFDIQLSILTSKEFQYSNRYNRKEEKKATVIVFWKILELQVKGFAGGGSMERKWNV